MKIRTNIQICNAVVVASILLTSTLLWFMNKDIALVSSLNSKSTNLELLADELRSHSDTLGQNLHFYLVSAKPEFKEKYIEHLNYFVGKTPRPNNSKIAPSQTISIFDILMQYAEIPSERAIIEELKKFMNHHIEVDQDVIRKFEAQNKSLITSSGAPANNASTTSQPLSSRSSTNPPQTEMNDTDLSANVNTNAQATQTEKDIQALEALKIFFEETHFQETTKIAYDIDTLTSSVNNRLQVQLTEVETILQLESLFAVFGMLSILVSNLFSQFLIHKRLLVPLTETTEFANSAANGDTTARILIAGNDEIAILRKAIVAFVRSLQNAANMQKLVTELEDTMNSLSRIAIKLEDSMLSSAQSAEEQTISIIETVTAMEEMNETVRDVSQSAETAATLSIQTKTQAEEGEQSVQKLINSINSVNEKSLSVKSDIATLLSHANNISSIMNVISDIADQTNLLALNAAIEAARAGDAGRGFAVVADEVRKLAEKTMSSTTGVASAIHAIQSSVETNRRQVDTTVEDVADATKLAEECGTSLHEIVAIAEESADKVMTITSASKKQSKTSEDIARAVAHVNSIASNTNTVINEVTDIIKTLIAEKNMLSNLINELKIDMTPGARKAQEKQQQQATLAKIDAPHD